MKPISKIHARVNTAVDLAAGMKILDATADQQNNNFWTEAENAYQSIKNATRVSLADIAMAAMNLNEIQLTPGSAEYTEHLASKTRLAVLVNTLTRDTNEYFAQLDAIHAQHAGKTGATRGADDHMLLMGINGAYTKAVADYHGKANALTYEINVLSGVVEKALQEQQAAAQDPTVVTDIAVKEVQSERGQTTSFQAVDESAYQPEIKAAKPEGEYGRWDVKLGYEKDGVEYPAVSTLVEKLERPAEETATSSDFRSTDASSAPATEELKGA